MEQLTNDVKREIIRQSEGRISAANFNDTYYNMFEEGQELLKTHVTTGKPLKIKILKKYPNFAYCQITNLKDIKICFGYRELSSNKVYIYG